MAKAQEEGPKEPTVCPECGSTELIGDYERAEVVCSRCGLVIDENLVDMGPEWEHSTMNKETNVPE